MAHIRSGVAGVTVTLRCELLGRAIAEVYPVVQIAVVDDNVLFRDFLGREDTLAPHHQVVLRATDAGELAELLPSSPRRRCDVILLDLRVSPWDVPDPMEPELAWPPAAIQGVAAVELL